MSIEKNTDGRFICEKLRKIRLVAGWSGQRLADETGVSLMSVQRYEKNRIPPFDYVIKVAELLDARPQYFCCRDDEVMFEKQSRDDLRRELDLQALKINELENLIRDKLLGGD